MVAGCVVPLSRPAGAKRAAALGRAKRRAGDRLLPVDGAPVVGVLRRAPFPDCVGTEVDRRAPLLRDWLLGRPHVIDVGLASDSVPAARPGIVRLRRNADALLHGVSRAAHPLCDVGGGLYRLSELAAYKRSGEAAGRRAAGGADASTAAAFSVQRAERGIGDDL